MSKILFITYEKYVPTGINSYHYERKEYQTEVDRFWTANDALKSFKQTWLGKLDRIVSTEERAK